MKIEDSSYKVNSKPYYIFSTSSVSSFGKQGKYRSRLGIVECGSFFFPSNSTYVAYFDMQIRSNIYSRRIIRKKNFTHRSLAIYAGKFQRSLIKKLLSQNKISDKYKNLL